MVDAQLGSLCAAGSGGSKRKRSKEVGEEDMGGGGKERSVDSQAVADAVPGYYTTVAEGFMYSVSSV